MRVWRVMKHSDTISRPQAGDDSSDNPNKFEVELFGRTEVLVSAPLLNLNVFLAQVV